jgi:hypothetical protein
MQYKLLGILVFDGIHCDIQSWPPLIHREQILGSQGRCNWTEASTCHLRGIMECFVLNISAHPVYQLIWRLRFYLGLSWKGHINQNKNILTKHQKLAKQGANSDQTFHTPEKQTRSLIASLTVIGGNVAHWCVMCGFLDCIMGGF